MMIKRKNNLDEFQEQKLLRIESKGVWLAFWLLIIVLAIQYTMVFGQKDFFKSIAGEFIVLICLSLYISVSCIKHGIWDRKQKPTAKYNTIISLLTSIAFGTLIFFSAYLNFGNLKSSIRFALISGILVFILCLLALWLTKIIYEKRLAKLEDVKETE